MQRYSKKHSFLFFLIFISFTLTACPKKITPLPSSYLKLIPELKTGDIIHFQTGYSISKEEMIDIVKNSRLVYIGETHDNTDAHRVQLEIIKELYELYPGEIMIGMEMFRRPYQETLDKWTKGELTEKEFVKQSKWYSNWGMQYGYYSDILEFIKEKNIPLIGLDVSKDLLKEIRTAGFENMKDIYKKDIPQMNLEDPYYRRFIEAYFSGHGVTGRGLDVFVKIQALRDEIMAETVAENLSKDENRNKKMIVLAGGSHVYYGFGIPRRVFRRLPVSYSVIIPEEVSIPEDKKHKLMDVKLPDIPIPGTDFFWMVEYKDLDKEKIRLGVMINDKKGKLKVRSVVPESLAEEIGLKIGDTIQKFNDEPLEEISDLLYLLDKEKPGNIVAIEILRDDEVIKMGVVLTSIEVSLGKHGHKKKK